MHVNHVALGATASDDALIGDLAVRRVDRVDLLGVLRIERTYFSKPWPYSASKMFVDEPAFLIAARGDEMLGYAVADVIPNHGNDIGHVKDPAVRPGARGGGFDRQLPVRLLTAMAIAGATVVKLKVRVSDDPAIDLYRSLGFESARQVPSYYGDGEDAHVVVLSVAGQQRA